MDRESLMKKREEFHRKLRNHELLEGYSYDDGHAFVTRPYWPLEPRNGIKPHLWKWSEIRPLVVECGEMVGLGRGSEKYDRRVLALSNPGSGADFTMTGPLFGDIQLIRPGESAPCHRHTPCATRIILEGRGGWTNVSGERTHVGPGDIVHTGQFPWHDHGNQGPDDFIFLDVLDIPLLYFTGTSSWEFDYEPVTGSKDVVNQPAKVTDFPDERYTNAQLRPAFGTAWKRNPADFAHLSWDQARDATAALAEEKGCPYDGIRLEMRGTDGGSVGTTVSVHTQWIRPGETTLSHRHTGATVHVCVDGKGRVKIEDGTYDFVRGDIFVIPSWHWHSFESASGCHLHAVSDLALIEKMKLYREQRKTADGRALDSGWTGTSEPFRS
jgi:gentisate 1,2-dioxygenase